MSASGSIWQNGSTGGFSNDLNAYRRLFQQQAERWHFSKGMYRNTGTVRIRRQNDGERGTG